MFEPTYYTFTDQRRKEGSKPPISNLSIIKITIIIKMAAEEVSKHQLGRACLASLNSKNYLRADSKNNLLSIFLLDG